MWVSGGALRARDLSPATAEQPVTVTTWPSNFNKSDCLHSGQLAYSRTVGNRTCMWLKLHGRWHFEYINLISANRTKEVQAILKPASQMRILRHREIKSGAQVEVGCH